MTSLEQLGVSVSREFNTSSVQIQGIEVRKRESTTLAMKLPRDSPITAQQVEGAAGGLRHRLSSCSRLFAG